MMRTFRFDEIAYNSTQKVKPTEADKEHYIGLEHIDGECLYISRWGSDVAPIGEKLVMRKGDILFGKRRAYQRKVAIAPIDGIFSAHGLVLRPKEDVVDKDYFPFFMSSNQFLDRAVQISVGGLSPTINWKDLARQEFTLPSLSEQKVLADKLWAAYRVKESYKKLLAATDDMLKAKFMEMFGDCDSSIECLSFEEVFTIKDNLRCPLNDTTRKDMHEGDALYPYYGANGLVDHINQYKIDMTAICLAEDCGKYGPGEETAYIIHGKSWVNNHAHILVPKDNCDIIYAKMLFTIMDLNKYVDNDNRKKLTQANMKKIKILCPPLPLQQQFVEIATQAEATKESLRKSIENIDQVIKSLINQ